ncbi:MAG: VWA domain-containing protein [Candidatus Acidiferrales bacterium]|jgi:VWFA-related protein
MTWSFAMLSRSASFVLAAGLLLPIAASAHPQRPTARNTPNTNLQEPQAIHTTTRLVQVSVIVENKNGAPITGLKKEDFSLFDDGAAQSIAFFSATGPAETPRQPLPANVFTNRSDLTGKEPGEIIVILYDELNTSFEDQAYARQHILRFLRSIQPQDHVAIFALTSDLLVLHTFSDDSVALANSVSRFSPQLIEAFDTSHPGQFHAPALSNDPFWKSFEGHVNGANAEIADSAAGDRYRITYAAFMAIADYVATIPGRKSLVWVSGGIPINIGTTRIGVPNRDTLHLENTSPPGMAAGKNLGGLAGVLNRVDMAIYPIDAHGIDTASGAGAFFSRWSLRFTFELLADTTGGKAFFGTNDLAGAIHSAFEDGRYSYTLGFYPDHGVWNGKFRKIKISLDAPDSRLRYRRGYFAFSEHSPDDMNMKTDLQEAARSPVDATDLGVTVSGKALPPASARLLQLQITLDPKQFLLNDRDNRRHGGLDLLFLQTDTVGKFLTAEKQHFDVNFHHEEYDSLAKSGLILQRRLEIDPASAGIRVLVRDAGSGALGSVTFPVKKFL